MQFKTVALAAVMAGLTVAQNATAPIPPVDPGSVDAQTKASWCNGQRAACNTLCDGDAPTNNCDATMLTFECLCADDSTPALEEYTDSLPDRICREAFAQCIASRPDNALGQEACKDDILSQCGEKKIEDYESGSGGSGSGSGTTTEAPDAEETSGADDENANQDTTATETTDPTDTSVAPSVTPTGAGVALSAGKGFAVLAAGVFAALL